MTKVLRTLYLANPFASRKKTAKWEKEFEKKFIINLINPFDNNPYELEIIKSQTRTKIKDYSTAISSKVVTNDIKMIKDTDGIVAVIDGAPSIGTIMEICYAFNMKKPVYTIATITWARRHPWIKHHSTMILKSFKEFEKAMEIYKK